MLALQTAPTFGPYTFALPTSPIAVAPVPGLPNPNHFSSLEDTLEAFYNLILTTPGTTDEHGLKLYCSLPDWDEWSQGTNLDFHDFREINIRLIVYLRALVSRLRDAKIHATYHLCPCQNNSSVALIRALPADKPVEYTPTAKDHYSAEQRFKIFIATVNDAPTLVMS